MSVVLQVNPKSDEIFYPNTESKLNDWLDLAKFMPNMFIQGKNTDIKKEIMRRVLHKVIFVWNESSNIVFMIKVLKGDTYDVCKQQIIGDSPIELETHSQKSIDEVIEIIKGGNKNE